MASQMKTKVDTRISHNKVQHIYGAIGGCQNDYVQFPKDAQNASGAHPGHHLCALGTKGGTLLQGTPSQKRHRAWGWPDWLALGSSSGGVRG